MTLASLRARLTRLEHDPRLELRSWSVHYHGQILTWIAQATRDVGLSDARQQALVGAVRAAWPRIARQCPPYLHPGSAAYARFNAFIWQTIDEVLLAQCDGDTFEQVGLRLEEISNPPA